MALTLKQKEKLLNRLKNKNQVKEVLQRKVKPVESIRPVLLSDESRALRSVDVGAMSGIREQDRAVWNIHLASQPTIQEGLRQSLFVQQSAGATHALADAEVQQMIALIEGRL